MEIIDLAAAPPATALPLPSMPVPCLSPWFLAHFPTASSTTRALLTTAVTAARTHRPQWWVRAIVAFYSYDSDRLLAPMR